MSKKSSDLNVKIYRAGEMAQWDIDSPALIKVVCSDTCLQSHRLEV